LSPELVHGAPRGALYTALLWQPGWYPHALPYMAYAPDAGAIEPDQVPPGAPDGRPVIVVARRRLPYGWEAIEAGRKLERTWQLDEATFVHLYVPR
jgi:hypothetical protein